MIHTKFARGKFLMRTGQSLIALLLLSSLQGSMEAQTSAKGHAVEKSATVPAKPAVMLNVRDFGALGDGKTKDTSAIQQALDRCMCAGWW
jgi:polygalacturonase